MKKLMITIAAALFLISTTAWAGKKANGENPAQETFQKEFKGAEDVKWNEGKEIITASFVLNSTRVLAYFDYSGELLGTARNILFNQLPLSVITEVNKKFPSGCIYSITEYTNDSGTFYKMLAETSSRKLKLGVSSSGDISIESKTKK